MKILKDINFKGKNVLVRCDFNVPLSADGKVLDDFRIRIAVPTIEFLLKQGARVILMTHLEHEGQILSLELLLPTLEKLLGNKIFFMKDYLQENARKLIDKIDLDKVVLLENLRFNEGEKENDEVFAKKLASLGDVFVNEAFSVSHRNHASVTAITKFLPSYAGFVMEKEIKYLGGLLRQPKGPFVAIMGGVKIQTKLKTILNMINIVDQLLLGSKLVEVIFTERGMLSNKKIPEVKFADRIDLTSPKLHLPVDGNIGPQKINATDRIRKAAIGTLKEGEDIYDIGPDTIIMFVKIIKNAKTILWNGPLGMYEDKRFQDGTFKIAQAISENNFALKIAGGGETIDAIDRFGLNKKFDFISCGGGAMLEFLAGSELPGIKALG